MRGDAHVRFGGGIGETDQSQGWCGAPLLPYQRLGQPTLLLREGAFLVARGRLAHQETTGSKVWIDQLVPISGAGSHMRVLATAVEHLRAGVEVD
jgi:hypothetical protein